jgi:hypothetical protein
MNTAVIPEVSTALAVPDSLVCLRCRYALRGLTIAGNCPECGTPIERSARGDLLVYSGRPFVSRLRTGATLVMTSMVLVLLGIIIPIAAGILMARAGSGGPGLLIFMGATVAVLLLTAAVLYLVGWWKVASPDPSQLSDDRGERPRIWVRWGVLLTVAVQLVNVVLAFGTFQTWFTEAVGLLGRVVLSAALLAGLLYVKWLAPRVPSQRVRKRSRTLIVLCTILVAFNLLTTVARFTGVLSAITTGGFGPFQIATGVVGLLFLITFIMYYNLFSWLRSDLKKVLDTAQA